MIWLNNDCVRIINRIKFTWLVRICIKLTARGGEIDSVVIRLSVSSYRFSLRSNDVRNNAVKHKSLKWDIGACLLVVCCALRSASTILHRINFAEHVHVLIRFVYQVLAAMWIRRRWDRTREQAIARKMKNKYVTLNDEEIPAALFSLLPFQMKSCKLIFQWPL